VIRLTAERLTDNWFVLEALERRADVLDAELRRLFSEVAVDDCLLSIWFSRFIELMLFMRDMDMVITASPFNPDSDSKINRQSLCYHISAYFL